MAKNEKLKTNTVVLRGPGLGHRNRTTRWHQNGVKDNYVTSHHRSPFQYV